MKALSYMIQYQIYKLVKYIRRYPKLQILATLIATGILLWVAASYMDVVANNMGSKDYSSWNLIVRLSDKF